MFPVSVNPSGNLFSIHLIMASLFTDSEWEVKIADTIKAVQSQAVLSQNYTYPALGSQDFARCMDHTLLKTDATPAQIDTLCDEAREYCFKV